MDGTHTPHPRFLGRLPRRVTAPASGSWRRGEAPFAARDLRLRSCHCSPWLLTWGPQAPGLMAGELGPPPLPPARQKDILLCRGVSASCPRSLPFLHGGQSPGYGQEVGVSCWHCGSTPGLRGELDGAALPPGLPPTLQVPWLRARALGPKSVNEGSLPIETESSRVPMGT